MNTNRILVEIDVEIARLQSVRDLLTGGGSGVGNGRVKPRKHNLSPEARKRIADAQKKRWAKAKKSKSS